MIEKKQNKTSKNSNRNSNNSGSIYQSYHKMLKFNIRKKEPGSFLALSVCERSHGEVDR
jgi:hypothetical protein